MYLTQTKDESHEEQNNDLIGGVLYGQNILKELRIVEKNKGTLAIDNLTENSVINSIVR